MITSIARSHRPLLCFVELCFDHCTEHCFNCHINCINLHLIQPCHWWRVDHIDRLSMDHCIMARSHQPLRVLTLDKLNRSIVPCIKLPTDPIVASTIASTEASVAQSYQSIALPTHRSPIYTSTKRSSLPPNRPTHCCIDRRMVVNWPKHRPACRPRR